MYHLDSEGGAVASGAAAPSMAGAIAGKCRHDYRTAAARWAIRALEAGLITVSDLKRAQQSARAFPEAFQQPPAPNDC